MSLLVVALVHRVGRLCERPLDLVGLGAERPRVGAVGAQVVVDHDPVARRVLDVDHGVERVVVDDDRVGRVRRRVAVVGHDHGDDVAHVAGLVDGDRPVGGALHVVGHRPHAGHARGPRAHGLQVGAGEHVADAGHGSRRARVDALDAGVGERAADHGHPHRPGDGQVVDVAGLARDQTAVLLAEQAVADGAPRAAGVGGGVLDCRGGRRRVGGRHAGTPSPASAAARTALTMLW
jgi:hypothetical protein